MRRLQTSLGILLALVALTAAFGCGGNTTPEQAASGSVEPRTGGAETSPRPADVGAGDFNSAAFDRSTTVDNTWFPLRPGTRFVYAGSSVEDGERLRHRVVFTVTDLTKEVAGVEAVVGWDRDYTDGELVEAELVFLAQDNQGNVWHLGQYPEEYEDGRLEAAPAWIAGVEGARAGVYIRASDRRGSLDYAQGYAPRPVNWADRARVATTGEQTCVPAGCYDDVLVVEEFERDKPGAFQLKYYAPGVGNVRVGWRGANEDSREVLVLTSVARLGPQEMARARGAVAELERRAYEHSKQVYGTTPPAHQ